MGTLCCGVIGMVLVKVFAYILKDSIASKQLNSRKESIAIDAIYLEINIQNQPPEVFYKKRCS